MKTITQCNLYVIVLRNVRWLERL